MANTEVTIFLKNSDGVDKAPTLTDIGPGEVAVNTVSGALYTRAGTGNGDDKIVRTKLDDYLNQTQTPVFSLPPSADEGSVVLVTVSNYDSNAVYTADTDGGVINTAVHPFEWVLPAVPDNTTMSINLRATSSGKIMSEPSAFQYIDVLNVTGIPDDTVLIHDAEMVPSNFETLTNASIDNASILATSSGIVAETVDIEQDSGDADWSLYQTTTRVIHKDIVDRSLSNEWRNTTTRLYLKDDYASEVNSGDFLLTKEGNGQYLSREIGQVLLDTPDFLFSQVAAGKNCLVSLDLEGEVWVYGDNTDGQLGNEFAGVSTEWVKLQNLPKIKYVATGNGNTMLITTQNQLYVAGLNQNNLLGTTVETTSGFVLVAGVPATLSKCYLFNHSSNTVGSSVLLCSDGSIYVCGDNSYGQLGMGNTSNPSLFTNIGITNVVDVSVSEYVTAIIKDDSSIWFTGSNNGSFGDGSTTDSTIFVETTGISAEKVICHSDSTTTIINTNGNVLETNSTSLTFISTGLNGVSITGDHNHYGILDNTNLIHVKGFENSNGELGLGDTSTPASYTSTGKAATTLHIGGGISIGTALDGTSFSAGYTIGQSFTPLPFAYSKQYITDIVPPLEGSIGDVEITVDTENKFATDGWSAAMIDAATGELLVKGYDDVGQIGVRDRFETTAGEVRSSFSHGNVVKVHTTATTIESNIMYGYMTFVITDTNELWGVGRGGYGFFDSGGTSLNYDWVFLAADVVDIVSSFTTMFFVKTDGSLWGAGYNYYGVLGMGNTTKYTNFTQLIFANSVAQISCSRDGSYYAGRDADTAAIIDTDGDSWVSGRSLIFGSDTTTNLFTQVSYPAGAVAPWTYVFVGPNKGIALIDSNGQLFFSGMANSSYRFGDNDSSDRTIPALCADFSGITVVSVVLKEKRAYVEDSVGNWYFSGDNSSYGAGDGTTTDRTNFELMSWLPTPAAKVNPYGIGNYTYYLGTDGAVYGSGPTVSTQFIRVLDGDFTDISIPTQDTYFSSNGVQLINSLGVLQQYGTNLTGFLGLGEFDYHNDWVSTGIFDAKSVYMGTTNTYLIKNDNSLWVTGYNTQGCLGLGHTSQVDTFTKTTMNADVVVPVTSFQSGTTTRYGAAFIIYNNDLYAVGYNGYGLLGLGDTSERHQLTFVMTGVTQVSCSGLHSAVVKTNGEVFTWGYNGNGALGLGDTVDRSTPISTGQVATSVEAVVYRTTHQDLRYPIAQKYLYRYATLAITAEKTSQYTVHPPFGEPTSNDLDPSMFTFSFSSEDPLHPAKYGTIRGSKGQTTKKYWKTPDGSNTNEWLKFEMVDSSSPVIGYTLSFAYPSSTVENFTIGPASPTEWVWQGCDDDTNWIDLDTVTDYIWDVDSPNGFYRFKTGTLQYTYYRILVSSPNNTYITLTGYNLLVVSDPIPSSRVLTSGLINAYYGYRNTDGSFLYPVEPLLNAAASNHLRSTPTFTDTDIFANKLVTNKRTMMFKAPDSEWYGMGYNDYGELGLNTTTTYSTPVPLPHINEENIYSPSTYTEHFSFVEESTMLPKVAGDISEIRNNQGNTLSFVELIPTSLPVPPHNTVSYSGDFIEGIPEKIFRNSVNTYTSLTTVAGDSYIKDVLPKIPIEVLPDTLEYGYNSVQVTGRFISSKVEGLTKNERVSMIKIQLEKQI